MVEFGDLPLLGRMASIACGLGPHVPGRLALGADRIVAIAADFWRSGEGPAGMTCLASDGDMRAGEREAGGFMIEAGAGLRISRVGTRHRNE